MSFPKKLVLAVVCLSMAYYYSNAQPVERNIRTKEYTALQAKLCTGWNTWYNNSVITHALLPQGFSISLCLSTRNNTSYLSDAIKLSDKAVQTEKSEKPEKVLLGLRSDDGSYTSLTLQFKGIEISVETATDGEDELILVSPSKTSNGYLEVEGGILWNKEGTIGMLNDQIVGQFMDKKIVVSPTEKPIVNAYAISTSPRLSFLLKDDLGFYTGKHRSIDEIRKAIAKSREIQQKRVDGYGEMAESFQAMQNILAWNTIYDAPNQRVITPVSRNWNQKWGGFVLFEWDTYFASYMLSLFNKDLAYANAIEITKAITPEGIVPNYQKGNSYYANNENTSMDRTEPPVGSLTILSIYNKYHEKWFLKEVYDELLTWNRWMYKNRSINGYLRWGSYYSKHTVNHNLKRTWQQAVYESGLDNSPMYDNVPFNTTTHTLEMADVGLMSLYIRDCQSLKEISTILGKKVQPIMHLNCKLYGTKKQVSS